MVAGEHVGERAPRVAVVASDALERQIHPVADTAPQAASRLVDGPLPIDRVGGPENEPTEGVADGVEVVVLGWGELLEDRLRDAVPGVGRDEGVTR